MVKLVIFTAFDEDETTRNEGDEEVKKIIKDAMVIVDASIEKIHKRLDDEIKDEWSLVDKMNAYTAVYNVFCNKDVQNYRYFVVGEFYDKYESIVKERVSTYTIPSLEDCNGEEFLIEVVIQWLELEQYQKYLQIIFARAEQIAAHLNVQNHSLMDICKTEFCDKVWEKFHTEIDFSVTKMKEALVFCTENPLRIDFDQFFADMEKVSNERLQMTLNIIKA